MALAQLSRCLILMYMCICVYIFHRGEFDDFTVISRHTHFVLSFLFASGQASFHFGFCTNVTARSGPSTSIHSSYAADCYFYSANYYLFSRICCTFSKWIKHKHLRKTINHVYAFYTANTVQWNRLHTHTRSHLWNSLFSGKFCIIISLDLKIIMFAKIRIQIHHLQFVNNKCSLSVCVANKHTVQL